MLTAAQRAARENKLTASRVSCLMTADEAKIMNLWYELVGDPRYVEEDLSGVWAVRRGEATEQLNLDWYERKTGKAISGRGAVVVHPEYEWAACTLDGEIEDINPPTIIEAKDVGGREPLARIIERYQPQMQWQMIVTGARQCALSVIMGGEEPVVEMIPRDEVYCAELWRRAKQFWACVESFTPPFILPPVTAPAKAEIVYDFSTSNDWCDKATTWLENKDAGKRAEAAQKALKELVPADAVRCFGGQVHIARDRAGRLSLREGHGK